MGSPSTTANGISPCVGAPVSALTGGGVCGTKRKLGLAGLAASSVKLAESCGGQEEIEEEPDERFDDAPKHPDLGEHQHEDDDNAKGLDAVEDRRTGGRQQAREHTPAVERWYREQIKNHQQDIDLDTELTDVQ